MTRIFFCLSLRTLPPPLLLLFSKLSKPLQIARKAKRVDIFKRAEKFAKEYQDKERDEIRWVGKCHNLRWKSSFLKKLIVVSKFLSGLHCVTQWMTLELFSTGETILPYNSGTPWHTVYTLEQYLYLGTLIYTSAHYITV